MSQAWHDWCVRCVQEARGYAITNGTSTETAMLRILSVLMPETLERFPDIELSVALKELACHAFIADHESCKKSG